jgi:hypothetical protein
LRKTPSIPKVISRSVYAAAFALTACTTVSTPAPSADASKPSVAAPSLGFFSNIRVPSGSEPVLRLTGRGAQVFRCERRDGKLTWVFRQPDAELADADGKTVGRHGPNFSFEHSDGSRLVSSIAAHDEAPNAADLRWLLLVTRSFGKGAFEGITHVQRVNTQGGMPPASCEAKALGQVLRVDFTSEFVFYRPRID